MIKKRTEAVAVTGMIAVVALAVSLAIGQTGKQDTAGKPTSDQGEPKLPAGCSEEDMKAFVEAGTPGKMHAFPADQVGVWEGKSQMWMGPAATEPATGTCTWTVKPLMDGRFIHCELTGELPGMGPFTGLGLTGYDNVSQKFVGSWLDNHNTGIMQGVGEISKDGKRIDWKYNYNCPITKKPAVVRQVDHYSSADTWSFDAFTIDPKSGEEFKCMHVDFTRTR